MGSMELNDGIHGMVPKEKMSKGTKKLRDFYEMKADAPIYQCEFGFYSMDRWKSEGYVSDNTNQQELFGYDEP